MKKTILKYVCCVCLEDDDDDYDVYVLPVFRLKRANYETHGDNIDQHCRLEYEVPGSCPNEFPVSAKCRNVTTRVIPNFKKQPATSKPHSTDFFDLMKCGYRKTTLPVQNRARP
ncbi:hypothetical protein DPMN_185843 [Dreissena polymorpha]|uniref:Uncharacterized protein n=1 Tax=Dreissena polymorpha TaxID=45954 RepID=A0A9D4DMN6_DREPO|nr:hypothetical protein DPMN_185843 [Dreissena polymorpha]